MSSMKAVRIHQYCQVDQLTVEDAPRPAAGAGEVLVQVHATAVQGFDCAARAGYLTGYYNYTFPLILGLDVSGVVEEVGPGVTDFAVGDEVYARTDPARGGAYAEYVAVGASEVAPKPASLDHVHAAALPHAGLTAWRALIEGADLAPGQTVLIHAAAGGVGCMGVQLAKWRGAKVIGTASKNNHEFLRELGADEVIDYNTTRFEDVVREVDVVLDCVGDDTLERSYGVLKPGGLLMSLVQPPSQEKGDAHGIRLKFVAAYPPAGGVLRELAALVKSGHLKPIVSTTLPLDEMQKAHTLKQGKHVRGALIIKVAE